MGKKTRDIVTSVTKKWAGTPITPIIHSFGAKMLGPEKRHWFYLIFHFCRRNPQVVESTFISHFPYAPKRSVAHSQQDFFLFRTVSYLATSSNKSLTLPQWLIVVPHQLKVHSKLVFTKEQSQRIWSVVSSSIPHNTHVVFAMLTPLYFKVTTYGMWSKFARHTKQQALIGTSLIHINGIEIEFVFCLSIHFLTTSTLYLPSEAMLQDQESGDDER